MAITKTTTLQRIEVYPASDSPPTPGAPQPDPPVASDPRIMVCLTDVFDSPSDDTLPVVATAVFHFNKGDDVSDMPALVQTVAAAICAA